MRRRSRSSTSKSPPVKASSSATPGPLVHDNSIVQPVAAPFDARRGEHAAPVGNAGTRRGTAT